METCSYLVALIITFGSLAGVDQISQWTRELRDIKYPGGVQKWASVKKKETRLVALVWKR